MLEAWPYFSRWGCADLELLRVERKLKKIGPQPPLALIALCLHVLIGRLHAVLTKLMRAYCQAYLQAGNLRVRTEGWLSVCVEVMFPDTVHPEPCNGAAQLKVCARVQYAIQQHRPVSLKMLQPDCYCRSM